MPSLTQLIKDINDCTSDISRLKTIITNALGTWDYLIGDHSIKVAGYSIVVGQEAGLTRDDNDNLYIAALLHDVGKLKIPLDILYKPGHLNEQEWQLIKRHPVEGASLVAQLAPCKHLAQVVLHHHEFYNGRGYPGGLTGEDTPLLSRIIAVTDAYEAMTSDRPFRRGFSHREAISRLKMGKRTQFDPHIVDCFLRAIKRL